MPLIQIPSLDSPPPPPIKPSGEPVDLYSADHWESAYRHMHDFPTLLIQAQDDLSRARKREAFWMSLFVHALLVLLILHPPDFAKYLFRRSVMLVKPVPNRQLTFLEAPPDTEKPVKPPNTDKLSDKNRIASTRKPQLDQREMQKILDLARKGRPGESTAPALDQRHPGMVAQTPPPQPPPQPSTPPPAPPQTAKLASPPPPKSFFNNQPMSANRQIQQAENATAATRGKYPGDVGELGLGQRQSTARMGPEILSDTLGVDFGPYLAQIVREVKKNWIPLIPESAREPFLKKGEVGIVFNILKDGRVAGLTYVSSSGDVALDRAAYGGISSSDPFPPLPSEFPGPNIKLRFLFLYNENPDGSDIP